MTKLRTSAKCAIRCQEKAFQVFLKNKLPDIARHRGEYDAISQEPWWAIRDKQHAAVAVRYILNIDSRRELDTNKESARRWSELNGDFEMWMRGI